MNLPDKIFITEYNASVRTGYFSRDKDDMFNQEYIRKDALIEWAKEMLVCFTPGFDCHETLKMVINHIESL